MSDPFMEGDAHRIVGVDVLRQTVNKGFRFVFGFKGAEETVPDNQCASMIAIEVTRVRGVVNAMMRRCVEECLEWAE